MARKEALLDGFMEKWAAGGFFYKNFIQAPRVAIKQMIRDHQKLNNSNLFHAQKGLSRAMIGTGALALGIHHLTKAPKAEEMASTYTPPQM